MAGYNYRFSIIPPGAIIDPRVTPRALQVLCLLGRHTNDGGWCSRSQVKMAKELDCSRSAVQEACAVLIDTGWVETRRNGRGGTGPESSEHPFAALSYRVKLDREDMPPELGSAVSSEHPEPPVETVDGGAAIAAGGAAQAAGGATIPAPLEGTPSEGISSEPERDSRARDHEDFAKWLSAFTLRWPTAAADDQTRIATAGRALTREQRKAAMEKIPAFLDHLKKHKRKHIPAGWKYLEELRWEKLPEIVKAADSSTLHAVDEGSVQWKIWDAIYRIARPRTGIPSFKITGMAPHRRLYAATTLPETMLWLCDDAAEWTDYLEGSNNHGAWRRWLNQFVTSNQIELHEVGQTRAIRAPAPWPPKVDGSRSSTDPPKQESSAA